MSAPRTARDRIRDEVTREILAAATEQLAQSGAAALSLRSVARQLEMAPSALYRYFASRDALLGALILGAYESLAGEAEEASDVAYAEGSGEARRWAAVPLAMRAWALGHPHEWGLIFGSPVPGYEAPPETIVPYIRLARALVRPIIEAHQEGSQRVVAPVSVPAGQLAAAVQPVAEALMPGLPTAAVARSVQVFATLIGMISLEVFGHWRNTVLAPELLFAEMTGDLASLVGLGP